MVNCKKDFTILTKGVIMMKKWMKAALLWTVMVSLLCGCDKKQIPLLPEKEDAPIVAVETTEPTVPATVPEDGDPKDVTCKGSYTGETDPQAVVAGLEGAELTNEELAIWYWAEVAQYRQTPGAEAPDFSGPLDTQACPVDSSVRSWQQYFLKRALQSWHTAQALMLQAKQDPLVYEEAYQINPTTHENNMKGKPATEFLYGYDEYYVHNTMHQSYLDQVPQTLAQLAGDLGYADVRELAQKAFGCSEERLVAAVRRYNEGYMYLTFLGYDLEPDQTLVEQQYERNRQAYEAAGITREAGICVDFRHILLTPGGEAEEYWTVCQEEAQELLKYWMNKTKETEATFAELAYRNSKDAGTAHRGGGYFGVKQGQLCRELDAWAFDASRKPGDTAVLRSEAGVHIVYFSGSTPIWQAEAAGDVRVQQNLGLMAAARERFPMEVQYSRISIPAAEGTVSLDQLLYPDVAHERYPEVPLYLQQDYPHTKFGGYKISTNGCGITTFSMLNTYMTDEEHTPPEMCAKYGHYSFSNGTDGMLFIHEPPTYGYFVKERTYDPVIAKQALEDGYIVISLQHPGYWTRGGHYLLLEKILDNGMIQVRDSNIANYSKLKQHKEDAHTWGSITGACAGFWIFEPKQTRTTACSRCGSPDSMTETLLNTQYLCPKCEDALIRRNTYLLGAAE